MLVHFVGEIKERRISIQLYRTEEYRGFMLHICIRSRYPLRMLRWLYVFCFDIFDRDIGTGRLCIILVNENESDRVCRRFRGC